MNNLTEFLLIFSIFICFLDFYLFFLIMVYTFIYYIYIYSNQCFYNISLYYQLINILNTKNNIFIIYLLLLIFFKNSKILERNFIKNTIICILILFLINSNVLLEVNKFFFSWIPSNTQGINTNLLNGLMLIHPIILYNFYIYLLYNMYIHIMHIKKVKVKNFLKKESKSNYTLFMFIFIAVILGCWWAEQELSWGGWWSWDFVELLALFLLVFFTKIIHIKNFKSNNTYVITFLIISIITVRYNLINSIHNFLSLDSQNQYLYYIIFFIKSLILLLVLMQLHSYLYRRNSFLIYNVFYSFIFLFLIYYYSNILMYYNNNILNININIKIIYTCILFFSLLILINNNYNIKLNSFFIFIFMFYMNINVIDIFIFIIVLKLFNKNLFKHPHTQYLHVVLILLLLSTFYQIYLFKNGSKNFFDGYITLYKIYSYGNIINNGTEMLQPLNTINLNFLNGFFKSFFIKITTSNFYYLEELYIYNKQLLIQPSGFSIFFLFSLTFFIQNTFFFYKKCTQY